MLYVQHVNHTSGYLASNISKLRICFHAGMCNLPAKNHIFEGINFNSKNL